MERRKDEPHVKPDRIAVRVQGGQRFLFDRITGEVLPEPEPAIPCSVCGDTRCDCGFVLAAQRPGGGFRRSNLRRVYGRVWG